MKIGDTEFVYNKTCTRCLLTTVNPETGEYHDDDQEPLRTLKSFRQLHKHHPNIKRFVGDSPVFGMHYSVSRQGDHYLSTPLSMIILIQELSELETQFGSGDLVQPLISY